MGRWEWDLLNFFGMDGSRVLTIGLQYENLQISLVWVASFDYGQVVCLQNFYRYIRPK